MFTRIKTKEEISFMRESGKILATVLNTLADSLEVGMSTKDLANIASKELKSLGGKPAFYGYMGFPDVLCVSINEEVVHGIPRDNKIISNGDIVSMDFGVIYNDMITDSAISVIAGEANNSDRLLLESTEKSMLAGIDTLTPGVKTGTIGSAIEKVLAKGGYGIVRDLVGHGVGHELHEDPNIPNYGLPNRGPKLDAGMTIAIEPMATMGTDRVFVADDKWTIITEDGSRSAHFEHTILITEDGPEILTIV